MYEPSKFYYDRDALGGVETSTSSEVFDHEIAHLTKVRSGPSKHLSKMVNGKSKNLISPVKMLAAREANYLRRSKFSSADCCHLLSRYLPSYGPFMVDRMESRAYVSQFSGDGSLLVAGFQDSNIRVYNAENGWNLQKDILAKSLRWTITDTYLSPDQRYLLAFTLTKLGLDAQGAKVYSSMSPIVHIVNVGSPVTKSLANVTDIFQAEGYRRWNLGYFAGTFSYLLSAKASKHSGLSASFGSITSC
ncbi:hypothetical protein Cgig2_007200 [Carnegiea gigantea]|uniref:Uncharacterized protein n=1 Tax=Carnegiea gigantea TaxID=171969 RepID=A0A9Q1GWI7_9CARY|nr:hypothetical protein Cgig2_007200 [Carnegiea gigantea]